MGKLNNTEKKYIGFLSIFKEDSLKALSILDFVYRFQKKNKRNEATYFTDLDTEKEIIGALMEEGYLYKREPIDFTIFYKYELTTTDKGNTIIKSGIKNTLTEFENVIKRKRVRYKNKYLKYIKK